MGLPVNVPSGDVIVTVDCPRCASSTLIRGHLAARLVVDEDGAALRAVLRAKPVEHRCSAITLVQREPVTDPLFEDTGPYREPDWAERAAGQ